MSERDLPAAWFDWLTWPLLVAAGLAATAALVSRMSPTLLTATMTTAIVAVVLVLEHVRPQRPRPPRTESIWRELGHVVVGLELGSVLGYTAAVGVAELAEGARGAAWWPASLPVVAQVALALLVVDLGNYLQHRTVHRVAAFWPFHALHHQPRSLDVVKTGRFHVADLGTNMFVSHLPLLALGPSAAVVAWTATINALAGVLQHTNVRLPTPAWLDAVVGTPAVHWRHHAADTDGNYASIYPLIDRVFGTWVPTRGRRPARLGIIDDPLPPGFLAPLLAPFRRR